MRRHRGRTTATSRKHGRGAAGNSASSSEPPGAPVAELRTKATFGARYFCTRGMIGCSLSHQRVWERVVDERLGAVVVLEDDAVLFPGFNRSLGRILRELPAG
eukprot:CAMPEP_0179360448 /NCGR_PEP_ID=MMETSP0797-20121207/79984_1 /TAXON_ID=47934 /ORGANISM="Dinophysis acuminata, Strain DAEP01" /LENGTH=102 /DNA_ID=CAMNT_0021075807 /DNA_START=319 /DNA_END=624 /DNA_ORIENTATION=-